MKIPTKPPPSRRSWMPLGSRGRFYGPLPMPIGCLDWPPRKPLDSGFHVDFIWISYGSHMDFIWISWESYGDMVITGRTYHQNAIWPSRQHVLRQHHVNMSKLEMSQSISKHLHLLLHIKHRLLLPL